MMETEDVIDEFWERQATRKSESTATRYVNSFKHWVNWLEEERNRTVWEADTVDLRIHLREMLRDDYAPSTITVRQSAVSQFYQECQKMAEEPGYCLPESVPKNPVDNLDTSDWKALERGTKQSRALREDIYYLSPSEIEQLCDNVPNPQLRNELMIRLLYQTGVRRSELVEIRLSDIDEEERSIKIRAEKTEDNREVYYQPSLDFLLDRWTNVNRKGVATAEESPYLFPTRKCQHITSVRVNTAIRKAAEQAGLQEELYVDAMGRSHYKITAHTLRNSFAVQSVKNGMDMRTLQKLLGHDDIEKTEKYVTIARNDVRDSARRFGAGTEKSS
jgi:integrase/recombinase XerD